MEFKLASPCDIGNDELEMILNLIQSGGEVQVLRKRLKEKLMRVQKFFEVWENNELIAIEAIKTPFLRYRKEIMEKLGEGNLINLEKIYYELGYLVVKENWRGKGISNKMKEALLPSLKHSIFTLLKEENEKFLERGLIKWGFKKIGSYPSLFRTNIHILIYVREISN